MPNGSIARVGTRVSVTMFVSDILAHQHQVDVEDYPSSGSVGARFTDGAGVDFTMIGDRSSVRMALSAALAQLGPDVTDSVPDIPVTDDKGVEDGK